MPLTVGEIEATVRLRDEMTARLQTVASGMGQFRQQLGAVSAAARQSADAINRTVGQNTALQRSMSETAAAARQASDNFTDYSRSLKGADVEAVADQVGRLDENVVSLNHSLQESQKKIEAHVSWLARLSQAIGQIVTESMRSAQELHFLVTDITRITIAPFLGLSRLLQQTGAVLTAAITAPMIVARHQIFALATGWESALVEVAHMVESALGPLNKLTEAGRAFELELRRVAIAVAEPAEEIARLAQMGVKLGLSAFGAAKFAQTVAEVGIAANAASDEIAAAFGRLVGLLKVPNEDLHRMASTVVLLGKRTKATVPEILELSQRIAAAGKLIGLTSAEVFGFSAAMASLTTDSQAASTALVKIFSRVYNAVKSGKQNLAQFAFYAGYQDVELFRRMFEADPSAAILRFIEGLGRLSAQGQDVFDTLGDIEFKDERLRKSMIALATNQDEVRRQIRLANQEWQANGALTEEMAIRSATTAFMFRDLGERLRDLGRSIGESLKPGLQLLLSLLIALTKPLDIIARALGELPVVIQAVLIGLVALAAVAGPMLLLVGTLTKFFLITQVFRGLSFALRMLGVSIVASSGPAAVFVRTLAPWLPAALANVRGLGLLSAGLRAFGRSIGTALGVVTGFASRMLLVRIPFYLLTSGISASIQLIAQLGVIFARIIGWPAALAVTIAGLALSFKSVRDIANALARILMSVLALSVRYVYEALRLLGDSVERIVARFKAWWENLKTDHPVIQRLASVLARASEAVANLADDLGLMAENGQYAQSIVVGLAVAIGIFTVSGVVKGLTGVARAFGLIGRSAIMAGAGVRQLMMQSRGIGATLTRSVSSFAAAVAEGFRRPPGGGAAAGAGEAAYLTGTRGALHAITQQFTAWKAGPGSQLMGSFRRIAESAKDATTAVIAMGPAAVAVPPQFERLKATLKAIGIEMKALWARAGETGIARALVASFARIKPLLLAAQAAILDMRDSTTGLRAEAAVVASAFRRIVAEARLAAAAIAPAFRTIPVILRTIIGPFVEDAGLIFTRTTQSARTFGSALAQIGSLVKEFGLRSFNQLLFMTTTITAAGAKSFRIFGAAIRDAATALRVGVRPGLIWSMALRDIDQIALQVRWTFKLLRVESYDLFQAMTLLPIRNAIPIFKQMASAILGVVAAVGRLAVTGIVGGMISVLLSVGGAAVAFQQLAKIITGTVVAAFGLMARVARAALADLVKGIFALGRVPAQIFRQIGSREALGAALSGLRTTWITFWRSSALIAPIRAFLVQAGHEFVNFPGYKQLLGSFMKAGVFGKMWRAYLLIDLADDALYLVVGKMVVAKLARAIYRYLPAEWQRIIDTWGLAIKSAFTRIGDVIRGSFLARGFSAARLWMVTTTRDIRDWVSQTALATAITSKWNTVLTALYGLVGRRGAKILRIVDPAIFHPTTYVPASMAKTAEMASLAAATSVGPSVWSRLGSSIRTAGVMIGRALAPALRLVTSALVGADIAARLFGKSTQAAALGAKVHAAAEAVRATAVSTTMRIMMRGAGVWEMSMAQAAITVSTLRLGGALGFALRAAVGLAKGLALITGTAFAAAEGIAKLVGKVSKIAALVGVFSAVIAGLDQMGKSIQRGESILSVFGNLFKGIFTELGRLVVGIWKMINGEGFRGFKGTYAEKILSFLGLIEDDASKAQAELDTLQQTFEDLTGQTTIKQVNDLAGAFDKLRIYWAKGGKINVTQFAEFQNRARELAKTLEERGLHLKDINPWLAELAEKGLASAVARNVDEIVRSMARLMGEDFAGFTPPTTVQEMTIGAARPGAAWAGSTQEQMQQALQRMRGWANQLVQIKLQFPDITLPPQAQAAVEQFSDLADKMMSRARLHFRAYQMAVAANKPTLGIVKALATDIVQYETTLGPIPALYRAWILAVMGLNDELERQRGAVAAAKEAARITTDQPFTAALNKARSGRQALDQAIRGSRSEIAKFFQLPQSMQKVETFTSLIRQIKGLGDVTKVTDEDIAGFFEELQTDARDVRREIREMGKEISGTKVALELESMAGAMANLRDITVVPAATMQDFIDKLRDLERRGVPVSRAVQMIGDQISGIAPDAARVANIRKMGDELTDLVTAIQMIPLASATVQQLTDIINKFNELDDIYAQLPPDVQAVVESHRALVKSFVPAAQVAQFGAQLKSAAREAMMAIRPTEQLAIDIVKFAEEVRRYTPALDLMGTGFGEMGQKAAEFTAQSGALGLVLPPVISQLARAWLTAEGFTGSMGDTDAIAIFLRGLEELRRGSEADLRALADLRDKVDELDTAGAPDTLVTRLRAVSREWLNIAKGIGDTTTMIAWHNQNMSVAEFLTAGLAARQSTLVTEWLDTAHTSKAAISDLAADAAARYQMMSQSGIFSATAVREAWDIAIRANAESLGEYATYSINIFDGVAQSLAEGLGAMLAGTKSFAEAFVGIWDGIKNALAQVYSEILNNFLKGLLYRMIGAAAVSKPTSALGGFGQAIGKGMWMPGFAKGGVVSGGFGLGDTVPAMLSSGEYVMPTAQTSRARPLLDAIRSGGLHMQGGGLAWQPTASSWWSRLLDSDFVRGLGQQPLVQLLGRGLPDLTKLLVGGPSMADFQTPAQQSALIAALRKKGYPESMIAAILRGQSQIGMPAPTVGLNAPPIRAGGLGVSGLWKQLLGASASPVQWLGSSRITNGTGIAKLRSDLGVLDNLRAWGQRMDEAVAGIQSGKTPSWVATQGIRETARRVGEMTDAQRGLWLSLYDDIYPSSTMSRAFSGVKERVLHFLKDETGAVKLFTWPPQRTGPRGLIEAMRLRREPFTLPNRTADLPPGSEAYENWRRAQRFAREPWNTYMVTPRGRSIFSLSAYEGMEYTAARSRGRGETFPVVNLALLETIDPGAAREAMLQFNRLADLFKIAYEGTPAPIQGVGAGRKARYGTLLRFYRQFGVMPHGSYGNAIRIPERLTNRQKIEHLISINDWFAKSEDWLRQMERFLEDEDRFAKGGSVFGAGTATSDSIPAMLSNGEFVIPAKQARKHLPLLEAIRSGEIGGYQQGGVVGPALPVSFGNLPRMFEELRRAGEHAADAFDRSGDALDDASRSFAALFASLMNRNGGQGIASLLQPKVLGGGGWGTTMVGAGLPGIPMLVPPKKPGIFEPGGILGGQISMKGPWGKQQWSAAGMVGIGGLMGGVQAGRQGLGASLSNMGSAAMTGFAMGGPIGAAIGGIASGVGALIGWWKRPMWKRIMTEAGRDWGTLVGQNMSEELAKTIEKDAKRIGDTMDALHLHVADIVNEVGGVKKFGVEKTITEVRDLFSAFERGRVTLDEVSSNVEQLFADIAKTATDNNGLISDSFRELLKLIKDTGLELDAVKEWFDQQYGKIAGGVGKLIGGLSSLVAGQFKDIFAGLELPQETIDALWEAVGNTKGTEDMKKALDDAAKAVHDADDEVLDAEQRLADMRNEQAAAWKEYLKARSRGEKVTPPTGYSAKEWERANEALDAAKKSASEAAKALKSLQDQNTRLGPGLAEIAKNVQPEFDRLSRIAFASFKAMVDAGQSPVEAMKALAEPLDNLITIWEKLQGAGLKTSPAFEALKRFRTLVKDNEALIDSFTGLNDTLAVLSNFNALTPEVGADIQAQAENTYQRLRDKGFNENELLSMMAPSLQTMRELSSKGLLELTPTIKEWIAKADQAGLLKATESTNEILKKGFGDVVAAIQGNRFGGKLGDVWEQAARGGIVTTMGKVLPFVRGGPVPGHGTDTVPALLTPGEMVLTAGQQRALTRRFAAPGTVGQRVDLHVHLHVGSREVAEEVIPLIPGLLDWQGLKRTSR